MVFYTLRGIAYFLRHPALWREVACPLLLTLVFGVAAAFFMFSHTLPRQRDWLDEKHVPELFAEMLGLCIVVTELFVSTLVYGAVCVDYYQDKIFACVLRARGLGSLLQGHERRSTAVRVCTSYFLSRGVLGFISLPLHLVPIVGSLVYAWLHGGVVAWENHLFYFELKGFGLRQQQRWIRRYKVQYSSFGMQALLLEMIPMLGPFFIFTNSCGAALLAEDLERDSSILKRQDEEETIVSSSSSKEYNAV